MLEPFLLRVIRPPQSCCLTVDVCSLASKLRDHLVLLLLLSSLFILGRCIWLDQVAPEYRVKPVLEEIVVTKRSHLSQGAAQLVLHLIIEPSLLILEPTKILGLRNDTHGGLPGRLFRFCLRLTLDLPLEAVCSILTLFQQIINSLQVFLEPTLLRLRLGLRRLPPGLNVPVPLGLGLEASSINGLVDSE